MAQCETTFFSGKGGVGKSTLASAFASAQRHLGRTLLVDLALEPAWEKTYEPKEICPQLEVCSLDLPQCLKEYVTRRLKIKKFVDLLLGNEKIMTFFETAPGVEGIIIMGKIFDLANGGKYDHVVVDAPATGHGLGFFRIASIAQKLFRVGPIHDQALSIEHWLKSAQVHIKLVTILEDLPVMETLEFERKLRAMGFDVAEIIVNHYPSYLPQSLTSETVDSLEKMSGERPFFETLVCRQFTALGTYLSHLHRELPKVPLRACDENPKLKTIPALSSMDAIWEGLKECPAS